LYCYRGVLPGNTGVLMWEIAAEEIPDLLKQEGCDFGGFAGPGLFLHIAYPAICLV